MAAQHAPASGLKGVSRWTSGTSGKIYSYVGQHGDLKKSLAYKVKPFRSGEGVRVIIGSSKDSRDQLQGLVGKFATHNVRPTGGGKGTAKVGPRRDFLGKANVMTMKSQAKILVETYNRALQVELV